MSDKFIGLSTSYYYADFELQGTRVTGDTQFKCPFVYESEDLHDLDRISDTILCYRGIDKAPNWLDIRTGKILIYRRVLVSTLMDTQTDFRGSVLFMPTCPGQTGNE